MEKKYIEDKQGNKVLPITHVSAVLDDNGNNIGSVMGAFEDEVRGLVDTPHQEYVTVDAYASLPAKGSKDTIYRVSNYNGSTSQVDASVYSEYAWNGTQYIFLCVKSQIVEVFDISVYNNNAKYTDLADALGTNGEHVPQSLQKGGMRVQFVRTYDNKYVHAFLLADEFTTDVAQWQLADKEITASNDNLATSEAVLQLNWDNGEYSGIRKAKFLNVPKISSGNEPSAKSPYFTAKAGVKYLVTYKLPQAATSTVYFSCHDSDGTLISGTNISITSGNTSAERRFTLNANKEVYVAVNSYSAVVPEASVEVISDEGNTLANVKNWILAEAYTITNVTKSEDLVTSANIVWPDGTSGSIRVDTRDYSDLITVLSAVHNGFRYYLNITRDSDGNVTSSTIS